MGFWKGCGWHRHVQEFAQGIPALRRCEHQKPVLGDDIAHFFVAAPVGSDGGCPLDLAAEGAAIINLSISTINPAIWGGSGMVLCKVKNLPMVTPKLAHQSSSERSAWITFACGKAIKIWCQTAAPGQSTCAPNPANTSARAHLGPIGNGFPIALLRLAAHHLEHVMAGAKPQLLQRHFSGHRARLRLVAR